MENRSLSSTEELQRLQNRVVDLERLLAQAQATIQAFADVSGNGAQRSTELLFTLSRDIILIFRRKDGRIMDANTAAVEAYGYSHAEMLALTIQDLHPPETHAKIDDHLDRVEAGGILFETIHRRKDGSTFPVEIRSQGTTIDGERTLISIIRDITERKQGEAERARLMAAVEQEKIEAQQRVEELNAIIEAMHDPVLVYSREGVIYKANASAVQAHGFDPSEYHRHETNRTLVIRHADGEMANSDDLPSARALRGEPVIGESLRITNEQGRDLIIQVTSTPLIVHGVQTGAVSVWHDITEKDQAETALRESEEKYRLFFDQLLETVSVFEAVRDNLGNIVDWIYLDVNQTGLRILDLPRDQVVGRSVSQVLGAEILARYNMLYRRVLETGEPHYHETIYQDRHFLVSISRMDENRVASLGLDITERTLAEQALRESEERFSKAFQASPDSLVISRLSNGHIIEINQSFERLFGYTREETLEKTSLELNMFADLPNQQKAIRQLQEQGHLRNFELDIHTRSGETHPVSLSVEKITIHREDHMLTVIHDLTERKQAEAALRENAALLKDSNEALQLALAQAEEGRLMLEALMEYIPIGIAITGGPPDFAIQRVSRYGLELTGDFSGSDLVGVPAGEHQYTLGIFLPGDAAYPAPEQMPLYRAAHFGEITQNKEMIIRTKLGARVVILVNAAPIRDAQGQIVAAINTWRDFTERKRLEEQLREAHDRAAWLARLPGENPNPVVRVSAGGIVLYHNPAAAKAPGWNCVVDQPLPAPLLLLVEQAMALGQEVQQDVQLGEGFYAVSVMPILEEAYANLYGREITGRKMAEASLRESEAHLRENEAMLRLALTAGRAGAWTWDLITDSLYWSDEYYRIFGLEPGSIPSSATEGFNRIHPDDLPQVESAVREAIEQGTPIDTVHRIIWPDGSVHWLRSISRAFNQAEGTPAWMAGIAMDISEQKRAEIELQAAHRRNIEILESISDAFYSLDPAGRFTYVNWKAASLWRKGPEELLGKNIWEVFPSGKQTESYAKIQQALTDRKPHQYESYSAFLDQWIEVHLFPTEQGISVYFQEITERKRTEQVLREREEILRLALSAGRAGAWSWDLVTHTVQWSDEYYQIFGFAPGEIAPSVEAGISRIYPEDRPRIEAVMEDALTKGTPVDEVHRVIWPDGSVHWVRGMSQAFYNPEGKPYRMAGIAIDVTQQKQAEENLAAYVEKLARSNQDLQDFAFIASHDLQEPLRKIEAFGDTLLDSATQLDDNQRKYIERMRSAAGRMQDMVDGLLQLSRVNTQGQPFERVDLSQIVAEVLSDLHHQVRRTEGSVEVGLLPVIEGDPLQIRQLLQNLISNALKYHRPDTPPVVKVYARQATDRIQILVEDNGIGFDPESVERMFQPFQRLVGRSQYEGSGMGLAICRRIVERHGGEITAGGEPGKGSVFIVTLPASRRMIEER